jgi:tRNA pseudouridine13 synthase
MTGPALPCWIPFLELPRAHGEPIASGQLRAYPEDFLVEEIMGFEPDGEGEHALLRIRKTGANTEWVARGLAAYAGLNASAVGYGGLKDRHAVTSQWFSVHLGSRSEPDWGAFEAEGVEILEVHRHRRKLRRGALRANRFQIRVRGMEVAQRRLDERVQQIKRRGVPNYFGAQRFGNGQGNLHAAHALFSGERRRVGRHLRGMWLSAARSQLFNEVLGLRVQRGDWDCPLPGDCMQLAGSRSHFLAEVVDDTLRARVTAFDVDPSGPLWGAGEMLTRGEPAQLEQTAIRGFELWAEGLASAGLRQERRPLRIRANGLEAVIREDAVELAFELPAGAYATAVLRELLDWSEVGG